MQVHTDMTRNHSVKCGIVVFSLLIVAFVLASGASAGLAGRSTPAVKSIVTPDEAETPAFPFFAEIIGDNVYVRSGPGTNFYECGKLNKGDKVKVVSKQFIWYRIVPPSKSFSWISTQYVDLDPENPGFGIVKGDHVRVYAGSNSVQPHHSASLQGKLNKGERVQLLGQKLDDHYKIVPPAFAYLCVSTHFAKPLPPTAKVELTAKTPVVKAPSTGDVPPVVKVPLAVKVLPTGEVPAVVKFDQSVKATVDPVVTVAPKPVPEEIMPTGTRLEQYYAVKEKVKAENLKPADKRDYKAIKKALIAIANDKEAGKAAKYAQKLVQQVKGCELAIAIYEKIRLQKEQLDKKTAGIDEAHTAKLAAVKDLGRFAVTGKLQPFTLYGAGHYRIVDESGKMLCYALPSGLASQTDLTSLIGQKVGIVGTVQPHLPTKKALVRFSEIVLLN